MTREEIIHIKEIWYSSLEYPHIAVDIAEAIKIVEIRHPHISLEAMYTSIESIIFRELERSIFFGKKYGHTSKTDRLEELSNWLSEDRMTMAAVIQYYRWRHDKKYYPETKIPIENQPPTEKQISYLRHLGHVGIPNSKKEAMDLLTQYLNGRNE